MNFVSALKEQQDFIEGKCSHCSDHFMGKDFSQIIASKSNFTKANLCKTKFNEANLSFAKFDHAIGQGAQFQKTTLKGAQFNGTDLRNSNFSYSDLRGARFQNVNLKDADFRFANLANATFTNCSLENVIGEGIHIRTLIVNPYYLVTYTSEVVQIGCKQFTRDQWMNASNEFIQSLNHESAMDCWNEYRDILCTLIDTFPAEPFKRTR